jgi:hypothetical protein
MCLFQLVPHLSHLESPHAKMEGEHDEEHGIILKPGLLVGTREDRRPGKFMGRSMATFFWVRSVEVCCGWAAVSALLVVMNKRNTEKVVLNQ